MTGVQLMESQLTRVPLLAVGRSPLWGWQDAHGSLRPARGSSLGVTVSMQQKGRQNESRRLPSNRSPRVTLQGSDFAKSKVAFVW